MTTTTKQQRDAIGLIGRYWSKGWSTDRTDAYARILGAWPATTIAAAVDRLGDEWRGIEAPPPSYIADVCRDLTPRAASTALPLSAGCPIEGCEPTDWVPWDVGRACRIHNMVWRTT